MSGISELQLILSGSNFVPKDDQLLQAIVKGADTHGFIRMLLQSHDLEVDVHTEKEYNSNDPRTLEIFVQVKMFKKHAMIPTENIEATNEMIKFLLLNNFSINEFQRFYGARFVVPSRTAEMRATSRTVGELFARFNAIQNEYNALRAQRNGNDKPYIAVPDRAELEQIIATYEARRATGESLNQLNLRVLFQNPVDDLAATEKKIQELYDEECDIMLRLARLRLIHGPSVVDVARLRSVFSL